MKMTLISAVVVAAVVEEFEESNMVHRALVTL